MSCAKNQGSLKSGMYICGCARSISYSAVVPHFGCPTMKKSGTRPPACPLSASSPEVLIAPQADEIAVEILAQGEHLGLEAPSQLEHQPLVRRWRLAEDHALAQCLQPAVTQPLRGQRLDRGLGHARTRTTPQIQRTLELIHSWRAHEHRLVRFGEGHR